MPMLASVSMWLIWVWLINMWSCTLFDTLTGQLAQPIDIPNVSWSINVSNCSLSTTKDKGTGEGEISSLTLSWEAVPGTTKEAKQRAIASYRRGLVLAWDDIAVVAGIIGDRKDRWLDTSFDLISPMDFLENRYIVREGTFGKGKGNTTTSNIVYKNLSLRAIACDLVRLATSAKQGGTLPIKLPYRNEKGTHQRTYYGYNVANNDCKKLLTELANVEDGIDIQFRPEFVDDQYLRWTLYCGSDAEPLFGGTVPVPSITAFPGGGTAENVTVAHDGATMRVYQTGAGQDQATLCYLAEKLTLTQRLDPYPLIETAKSNTDDEKISLVKTHANANLANLKYPVCQVTCDAYISEPNNPVKPGYVWPGEPVSLYVEGHPALPDGAHQMRLMEMSGDLGTKVQLTFDVIKDPLETI